jgi:hypothetical protein
MDSWQQMVLRQGLMNGFKHLIISDHPFACIRFDNSARESMYVSGQVGESSITEQYGNMPECMVGSLQRES